MIFDAVFSPISWLLKHLGLITKNINFLGGPILAIASVCLANIWRGIPFFGIIILAGLQAVPQELHEAASIDGAGVGHRFRHVTIPAIAGVVLIALARRTLTIYLPLGLFLVFLLFPFYWMTIVSLKPTNDIFELKYNPFWIRHFTLENYLYLFKNTEFPSWVKNTIIVSTASIVLSLACSVFIGYALA